MKKNKSTFSIDVRNVAEREAELHLNGYIDIFDDEWSGLKINNGNVFTQNLRALYKDNDKVTIVIGACYGGVVYEGLPIYNEIANAPIQVNTKLTGLAASMGAIIFLAGHEREMSSVSQAMIHGVSGFIYGTIKEMEDGLAATKKLQALLGDIIEANSTEPRDVINSWMEKDTWINPDEAKKYGLADIITPHKGRKVDADAAAKMSVPQAFQYYQRNVLGAGVAVDFRSLFEKSTWGRIAASFIPSNDINKAIKQPTNKMDLILEDGTTVFANTDTTPAEGDFVYTDAEMTAPLGDGEYTISEDSAELSNHTMTVEGGEGQISTIAAPAEEEEEQEEEAPADAAATARIAALQRENAVLKNQLKAGKASGGEATHTIVVKAGDGKVAGSAGKPEAISPNQKMANETVKARVEVARKKGQIPAPKE